MKTKVVLSAMIAPAILLYIVSFAVPMVVVGRLSFFKSNYIVSEFVGLGNYVKALQDYYFQKSFFNAFVLMVFIIPISLYISYKLAAALSVFDRRSQGFFRFMLHLPSLVAGIVIGMVWRWMLNETGLINQLLSVVGMRPIWWLVYAWPARISLSVIQMSAMIGGQVLFLSATICSIPLELHDVAQIDGANERKYNRYILRPLLRPMFTLITLLNIIGIMQIWGSIYVVFNSGGPEGSVATPVYEIFLTAFEYSQQGRAAAKGIILMVVIALLLMAKQRVEKWAKQ